MFVLSIKANLSRERSLKHRLALSSKGRARTPQRIALRKAMGVRLRKPMRMAGADVAVGIAIRRRGLRQPRRITDRAEIDGRHVNVVANRLEPF